MKFARTNSLHMGFLLVILLITENTLLAQSKPIKADALFPETSVAYVQIDHPSSAVDLLMTHPLKEKILEIEDVAKALESKEFFQFQMVLKLIEGHIDMTWQEAIEALTANGLTAVYDSETEGGAVIAHARTEDELKQVVAGLLKLAKLTASQNGGQGPKEQDYRGIKAIEFNKTLIGILGTHLLITNKKELAKSIADRYLDEGKDSLARKTAYQTAKKTKDENSAVWGYVDMASIKEGAPEIEKLLTDKAENFFAELLIGGIQESMKDAPFATTELFLTRDKIQWTAQVPHDLEQVVKTRGHFFGKDGTGLAPPSLIPDNIVANVTSYRDIAALWNSKDELFDEKHIAELNQVDSMFSLLIGGLDFGQDVLGSARPGVQIVAAEQDYDELTTPKPEIKIPSFAIIFRLDEHNKVLPRFKVGFQSMLGFLNIQFAQEGYPLLDVETESAHGGKIVSGTYIPDEKDEQGLIHYNFSPSIAYKNDYFMVSSTKALAKELLQKVESGPQESPQQTNTLIEAKGSAITSLLKLNRESLVAQNMLEEGNNREQAEREVDILIEISSMASGAKIRLANEPEQLKLEVSLSLNQ